MRLLRLVAVVLLVRHPAALEQLEGGRGRSWLLGSHNVACRHHRWQLRQLQVGSSGRRAVHDNLLKLASDRSQIFSRIINFSIVNVVLDNLRVTRWLILCVSEAPLATH